MGKRKRRSFDDRKKRQSQRLASQKWRMRNPDKVDACNAKWERNNAAKLAKIKLAWQEKNPEKVAKSKFAWQEKNPEKVANSKLAWHEKNPEKVAKFTRAWQEKNPEKVAKFTRAWQEKNPEKVAKSKLAWREKNPEKAAKITRAWQQNHRSRMTENTRVWKKKYAAKVRMSKWAFRLRCALKIRSKYRKWYQANVKKKRAYRMQKYRENLKVELLLRKQRYRIDLIVEKQYHRSRSIVLLKAGQAAAESKFTRAIACNAWKKEKRPVPQLLYEAKILVAKGMNARLKCVMRLKKAIAALVKQSQKFLDKFENAGGEVNLENVCGSPMHCRGRELYFYEAAYKVVDDKVAQVYVRGVGQENDDKLWPCNDQGTCLLQKDSLPRLLAICKTIVRQKNFRRYMAAGIDKCKHRKHAKKSETPGPEDMQFEYEVLLENKLGHSLACFPDNCESEVLFLRRMGVHYSAVFELLCNIYQVRKFDKQLHEIDTALARGDEVALKRLSTMWSSNGVDVAQDAGVTLEKSEDSIKVKIKSLPYAIEFLKDIHTMPVYACASCRVLHYRSEVRQVSFVPDNESGTVKVYTGTSLKRKDAEKQCNDLWLQLYGAVKAEKRDQSKVFVCHQCFSHLTKGAKHAPVSVFNKLEVPDMPGELADLNEFEKHFIQKAKCFQVIYRLGTVQSNLPAANKVKAHKGQVVHYPLPLSETLRTLPAPESMPADQNAFVVVYSVPTKNKMVWKALVDVGKIKKAIAKLKQINPEYKDVDENWAPFESIEMTQGECDPEIVQECQKFAQKPMLRKIGEQDEAMIMDEFTVRPMFKKKPDHDDLELYQMERVEAESIDPREDKLDLWCFPHLYPNGKNGEGEKRDSKVSNADFISSQLHNENPKFRHDHQYLFYLLHKYQLRAIANSITQMLRNTYAYNNVPVGEFVGKVAAGEQELEGNLFTAFSKIRGTAEYWAGQRMDLRTMCREIGPPTWFLTFSAAEYDWEDMRQMLIEVNKSVQGINEMSNGERCAMDPVFTAKHFHHRFRALMKHVILNKDGPLGDVNDFFWWCEYQARGAAHFHMVVWVKDAPRIGVSPPDKVLKFIQKFVKCRLPNKDQEPLLHKLVTGYQMHRCNSYCKKIRRKCRFGFPQHQSDVATLNDPLKNVGQRLKGKSESRLYTLPRMGSEGMINDYNPELLLMWQANMDIQFIGENTHAVVNYIASYVTKKEKSALQDLWDSLKQDKSAWSRLFNIGCRSLATRECGAYEAADLLVGQRLFQKSRQVRYICACQPHLRPRVLNPLSKLKAMDPHSTDKYEGNWISTYYPDRPDSLESMCLYDFMRLHDRDAASNEGPLAFKTATNGRLVLRSKPYLISHAMYSFKEKLEEYCYSLLLLFKPFRNESEELIDADAGSCIPVFERELLLSEQLAEYNARLVVHEEEDQKNKEAIEKERQAVSQHADESTPAEREPEVMGEPIEAVVAMQEFEMAMQNDAGERLEDNVATMNADQLHIFTSITGHLKNNSEPLQLFISGAGGTGKSFLVNTLKLWMQQEYGKERTSVAVAAPTGLAAFNVNGVTLHRLFQLPVQHGLKTEYTPLADDVCKQLRQYLKYIKVIVIDEISMVSNVMLTYLHLRLNEIFNHGSEHVPFGNRSLIIMGDLAQLPPVGDPPAFCPLTPAQANKLIGGWGGPDLWGCFTYDELTINMRQKADPAFAQLLDRLRFGQSMEQDASELQQHVIPVPPNVKPLEAFGQKYLELRNQGHELVCLMPLQKMVNEFNEHMLRLEENPLVEVLALDSFQYMGGQASKQQADKAREQLKKKAQQKGNTETAGIEDALNLCIGARVMLRRNILVDHGLVNGAIGRVMGLDYLPGGKIVDKVLIKFDNIPTVQTICRSTAKFELMKQLYVNRRQFPLILSYGMTIHKAQGLSLSTMMADVGNTVFDGKQGAGMTYVALSQVRTAAGLHLINFDPSKAYANAKCLEEINQLRSIYTPHLEQLQVSKKRLKKVPD